MVQAKNMAEGREVLRRALKKSPWNAILWQVVLLKGLGVVWVVSYLGRGGYYSTAVFRERGSMVLRAALEKPNEQDPLERHSRAGLVQMISG